MRYVFETGAGKRSPEQELQGREDAIRRISELRFNGQKVTITDIDEFDNCGLLKASAKPDTNGNWVWKRTTPPKKRPKSDYAFTLPLGGGTRREYASRKAAENHARKIGSVEILEIKNPDQFENRDVSIGQGDTSKTTGSTKFTWRDFG